MKYTVQDAQIQPYLKHFWVKEHIDITVSFAKDTYDWKKFHRPYDILIKDECGFKPFSDLFYLGKDLIQIPVTEKQKIRQCLIINEYKRANYHFILCVNILCILLFWLSFS